MTDKEVKKLKKPELLEIIFYLQKEMDTLKEENEHLRCQVDNLTSSLTLSETDLEKIKETVSAAINESFSPRVNVRRVEKPQD